MPKGDVFHYFHPIAFLQHMKLITVTNVIYIYSDGTISKLDLKGLSEITYVYVSSNGKEYKICTCELLEIDERLKGVAHGQKIAHTIESGYDSSNIVTYAHASSRKKYTYPDGTIRTYGPYDGGFRRVVYKKGAEKKRIIKMPKKIGVKIDNNKVIAFKFTGTARTYCDPEVFAGFIGVLGETGYPSTDIISTGMCEEDGTCFPSITHNNGQSIDIKYLKKNGGITSYMYNKDFDKVRMQKIVDGFVKFNFKYLAAWKDSEGKLMTNTKKVSHHHHHFHAGNLNKTKIRRND